MEKNCCDRRLSTGFRPGRMAPLKKGVRLLAGLLIMAVFIPPAFAADFQIQPTSLDLGGGAKSGAFSVINNGNEKIDFQISVKEW
ncbi:MAG TPA: hypothetical protein VEM40_09505, partial [Nitrospirota bacterium]|nr:hypothetical protein [Nitrospirota bacterium]